MDYNGPTNINESFEFTDWSKVDDFTKDISLSDIVFVETNTIYLLRCIWNKIIYQRHRKCAKGFESALNMNQMLSAFMSLEGLLGFQYGFKFDSEEA